jgi:rRNA pseudouridine-1189 N-methylase Emg1 (Nep1/Mra1 family)
MNRPHSSDNVSIPSGPLRLKDVLADLLAEGHIPKDEGNHLLAAQRSERADQHPLALIHAQKWRSLQRLHLKSA